MFETSLIFNKPPDEKVKSNWSSQLPLSIKTTALVILLLSGIACTAWGTWQFLKIQNTTAPIGEPLLSLVSTPIPEVYVDISGAVEQPGIYSLEEGSRVAAAIDAAGGLSSVADHHYLHTSFNLSARVKDEQKIYIPYEGESAELATDQTQLYPISLTTNIGPNDSLISINSASEAELDELPKIGPATAGKIIEGRPYTSIDELTTKNVVSQSVFEQIKALIKI